jgi:hypothetical protein
MPTQSAEVQHLVSSAQNRIREIEQERESLLEMIRVVLDTAPKLTGVKIAAPAHAETKPVKSAGRKLQNRNVTALVREYIDNFGVESAINVPTLVKDYLQKEHGAKGEYRSLYSGVMVILKKETKGKDGSPPRLTYEKGVGFYKPRRFGQKLGAAPTIDAR